MKKWKCPKCGTISKYDILCQGCDYEKPFFKWLFQLDNPLLYFTIFILILLITPLIK